MKYKSDKYFNYNEENPRKRHKINKFIKQKYYNKSYIILILIIIIIIQLIINIYTFFTKNNN